MLSSVLNAIARRRAHSLCRRIWLCVGLVWIVVAGGCGENTQNAGAVQPKVSAAFDAAAHAGQQALEGDQPALAQSHFATALKIATTEFPANDPRIAMTWMFLGTAQTHSGDFPAAEQSLTQAADQAQANLPADKQLHADICFRRGDLSRRQGRADEADTWLKQAAAALPEKTVQVAVLQARILRSQALTTLLLRRQPAAAEALFQASLERLQAAQTAAPDRFDPGELCALRNDYATCCLAQQKLEAAAAQLAAAAEIEQGKLADSRVAAETNCLRGRLALANKDFNAAETHLVAACGWYEKPTGEAPGRAAPLFAQRDLIEAHLQAGHKPEAAQRCATFVAGYESAGRTPQPGEPQAYAWVLNCQAGLYVQADQLESALGVLEKLQAFYETNAGAQSPVVAQTCADRAVVLKKLKRDEEAAAAERQAQSILGQQPPVKTAP